MHQLIRNVFMVSAMICIFAFYNSSATSANTNSTEQEIFQLLKDASEAQLTLSEKERSLDEINNILNPYFTNTYINFFLEEHLLRGKIGYKTGGTDFTIFYIPFFSYTDETKIINNGNDTYYIAEFFPNDSEEMSLHEDHYEYVMMRKISGEWKITRYGFEHEEPEFLKERKDYPLANPIQGKVAHSINNMPLKNYTIFSLYYVPFYSNSPLLLFASSYNHYPI